MSDGPWLKYQKQGAPTPSGPWDKYRTAGPTRDQVGAAVGSAVASAGYNPIDETKRIFSSTNEQLAGALGAPVDAANWLLRQVGVGSEKPFLGSESIAGMFRDVGASGGPEYQPRTDVGKYAAAGLGGAGSALVGGTALGYGLQAAGKGVGMVAPSLGQATTAAGKATITPALDAAAGAGAGLGMEGARQTFPGNQWAEAAGGLLGAFAPAAVMAGKAAVNPTIDAMRRLGVSPTAGTVGSKTGSFVQNNMLAQMPGAAGVVQDAVTKNLDEVTAATGQIARQFGNPSGSLDDAGRGIQNALGSWFQKAKGKAAAVYDQIGRAFQPDERFFAGRTLSALDNPAGKLDSDALAKVIRDPTIARYADAIAKEQGQLSYNDLKQFRSYVGGLLEPGNAVDIDQAQLRRLYGALTEDLKSVVATRGPELAGAWARVTADYADTLAKYTDNFERLIGKRAPVGGEAAYNALVKAAGNNGDFARFAQVWQALPTEERGNLAATILVRMGVKTPDAVSDAAGWTVAKFLRDYDALAPKAKALLFRTTGNSQLEQSLDDLVTVVGAMSRGVDKVMSTSRSGAGLLGLSQASAVGAALHAGQFGSALAMLTGPYVAAKLMTSPRAVRALSAAIRLAKQGGNGAVKAVALLKGAGLLQDEAQRDQRGAVPPAPGAGQ